MTHFFITQDPQLMMQFYQDIVSSSIFNNSPSFLQKYPDTILTNYSIVLYLENLTKSIVKQTVMGNAQKLNQIKQIVSDQIQHTVDNHTNDLSQQQATQIINAISQGIFLRLQQIKTVYLMQAISLGSMYLQDVNWKVTKTISSSAKSFVNLKHPYNFSLTLYLKENTQVGCGDIGLETRAVTLEMSKVQLKQFLAQVKAIKQEMN